MANGRPSLEKLAGGDPVVVDAFFWGDDFDCALLPEPVAVALYGRLAQQLMVRTTPEATFIAGRVGVLDADGACPVTRSGARASSAWRKAVEHLRAAIVVDGRLPRDVRARAARALFASNRATASLVQSVIDQDADAVDVDVAWRVLLARIDAGHAPSAHARRAAALRVAHAIAAQQLTPKAVEWPETLANTCGRAVIVDALTIVVDAGYGDDDVVAALVVDDAGLAAALARVPRLSSAALTRVLLRVAVEEQTALATEHWSLPAMRAAVASLPRDRVVDDAYVDLALATLHDDPAPSIALLAAGGVRAGEELRVLQSVWLSEQPPTLDAARRLAWSLRACAAVAVDVDGVVDEAGDRAFDQAFVDDVASFVAFSLPTLTSVAALLVAHGGVRALEVVIEKLDEMPAPVRAEVRAQLARRAPLARQ